ncbi:MAG: cobyric acid synthase [Chloroflexi bacterium]|nr:cobyric acid synthase [Chloroflexota bacterium]
MRQAKTLMVQGTSSSAGKSILVTALCRILKQDGFSVAPFKAQNMALNSFVTREGGEIGRAQAVQAEAAGVEPSVDMNPVLLKPQAESMSQVIIRGKVDRTLSAAEYYHYTATLLDVVRDSLTSLRSAYDVVVIEGAGSPAELNLKDREIVNMRIARMARSPVLLVGDIDRGGVFASLVGTLALLDQDERDYIKGFIINKFRGDLKLLQPGLDMLESRTLKPVLGVVPYFRDIHLAQEDSVYLDERVGHMSGDLDVAIIRLPHISNYDDFDPLEEDGCRVRYVTGVADFGSPHFIILPGTKSTISDLHYLRRSGLAEIIVQQAGTGTPVAGICGGYQMLGTVIFDPHRVESGEESVLGLGLLDAETTFHPEKSTSQVKARVSTDFGLLHGLRGKELTAYEIHMGQTVTRKGVSAFHVFETPRGNADHGEGTINARGTILGTYLHGLFHNLGFRQAWLNSLRRYHGLPEKQSAAVGKEQQYDRLAALVRGSLDMPAIYRIMEDGIRG